MKLEEIFFIDAPPEKVMAIVKDPDFIKEEELARDNVSVDIEDVKKTKDEHVFIIHLVSYRRGLTGIDRSKTEKNQSTVTWDLKNKKSHWVWKGFFDHADKANINGGHTIVKKGTGSELTLWVDISISVPILGKKISKLVSAGFKKEWPNHVNHISQKLRG